MRKLVMMAGLVLVTAVGLLLAQTPAETPLSACQKENEARAAEVARLKAEVEKLKETVVGLSKRLTGATPAEAPAPSSEASIAKLLVLLKTKYGRGHSCTITANGREVGKVEYPDLEGPDRVMDYSSGFIRLQPGDYRLTMTCKPTRSKDVFSVDKDISLEGGGSYTLHTKINVWTKRLQLEESGKD